MRSSNRCHRIRTFVLSMNNYGNCSDLKGSKGLKGENRGRIPVADAQVDGYQTAFAQFDSPSLNSYQLPEGLAFFLRWYPKSANVGCTL